MSRMGSLSSLYLAFGSFVGPHIAFAGGVAAAGYAGRKGKLASGTEMCIRDRIGQ